MMTRRPRGYVGRNHETLGAVILSVLQILKLPEQVLGAEATRALAAVQPGGWYPVDLFLDLIDKVDAEVGTYGLLRLGRMVFKRSHEERAQRTLRSAREILYGFDGMYRAANRGTGIGGWQVTQFEPGHAELEKTTPHHCGMEQGILSAACAAMGCPVTVTQSHCFREGADACVFVLSSPVTDQRWGGTAGG